MTSSAPDKIEFGNKKEEWIQLINESVHTSNDIDIGDIDAVSRDFVVIKRGFINVHYYYIPIHRVEGWDGNVLWLKITEDEVKRNYERDIVPNPSSYYVRDYPVYRAAYYPRLITIPSRYVRHSYADASPSESIPPYGVPPSEAPRLYQCDLCGKSDIKSEEDLSEHVKAYH